MTRGTSTPVDFGYYVVGVFDLLGQREKICAMPFVPRTSQEVVDLRPILEETFNALAWLSSPWKKSVR